MINWITDSKRITTCSSVRNLIHFAYLTSTTLTVEWLVVNTFLRLIFSKRITKYRLTSIYTCRMVLRRQVRLFLILCEECLGNFVFVYIDDIIIFFKVIGSTYQTTYSPSIRLLTIACYPERSAPKNHWLTTDQENQLNRRTKKKTNYFSIIRSGWSNDSIKT